MSPTARRQLARVREERALALLTQGKSQREIAIALGMSQTGVSKALRRLEARILEQMDDIARTAKVRELLKAQQLYREAFDQWEKSKKEKNTRTRRTITTGGNTQDLAQVKTEEGIGDPRFLSECRAALALEREILGLNEPTKVEHVHTERPAEHLTDDELNAKLEALMAQRRIH